MRFAQLEYFLAITRSGKFCQAAEQAYITQSSLSKQIKALECELGVELFVRSPTGVTLTPAGETFLEFADTTFREYERVLRMLGRYSSGASLLVRVGALPLMTAYDLHPTLSAFQVDNMSVQIDLFEREQTNLIKKLDLNLIDLAILRTDQLCPDKYEWVPLVRDEIVVICPSTHPLSRAHRIAIKELRDERFVLMDEHSAIHKLFIDECHAADFAPNVVFTHARHEPLLSAVQRQLGITVLPQKLSYCKSNTSLVRIPLEHPLYTDIGLVHPKGQRLTPWAEKLVEFFRAEFAPDSRPGQSAADAAADTSTRP